MTNEDLAVLRGIELATAEVTATVSVQLPLAGILPPLRASELPLAAAVAMPPQVLVSAGVAVLVTLAG